MRIEPGSEALTPRATRVLGELSAASEPVTVVFIGHATPVQGRVSFAHGSRAAVVVQGAPVAADRLGARVVLSAISRGRAVALCGQVVDVSDPSLSIAFSGDLRGTDSRSGARTTPEDPRRFVLEWDAHSVDAVELNHSQDGLCVVVPDDSPTVEVGAVVRVRAAKDTVPVYGYVRHAGAGAIRRMGLQLDADAPGRPASHLASGPEAR